jgi:hypothetical protein
MAEDTEEEEYVVNYVVNITVNANCTINITQSGKTKVPPPPPNP